MPVKGFTGNMLAITIKYVGLQVENTGPSAEPTITSPQKLFLELPLPSIILNFILNFARKLEDQILGKIVINPRIIMSPPDKYFQVLSGMFIKRELAFNSKVNTITDTPSESITVNIFFILTLLSLVSSDLPIIIGKSGSMHGASTVSIPAIKQIIKKSIFLFWESYF